MGEGQLLEVQGVERWALDSSQHRARSNSLDRMGLIRPMGLMGALSSHQGQLAKANR